MIHNRDFFPDFPVIVERITNIDVFWLFSNTVWKFWKNHEKIVQSKESWFFPFLNWKFEKNRGFPDSI